MTDINLNINIPDLETLLLDAMESMSSRERQVQDRSGHHYSLRIQPFKTLENLIDGVVMLLIDTEPLRRGIERADFARDHIEAVIDAVRHPLVLMDANDLKVEMANQAFYRLSATTAENAASRPVFEVWNSLLEAPELKRHLAEVAAGGNPFDGLEIRAAGGQDGECFLASARRVELDAGMPPRILLALETTAASRQAPK